MEKTKRTTRPLAAETDDGFRLRAKEKFLGLTWPNQEIEAWRRTPVPKIGFGGYRPYPDPGFDENSAPAPLEGPVFDAAGTVSFRRGRLGVLALSSDARTSGVEINPRLGFEPSEEADRVLREAVAAAEDRVQVWQLAELTHGAELRLPDGSNLSKPLLADFSEGGDGVLAAPALVLLVGENARAEIVVRVRTERASRALINLGVYFEIGSNSSVNLVLDQDTSGGTRFFSVVRGRLSDDAELRFTEIHLGGEIVKTSSHFDLASPGSSVRLAGLYRAAPASHLDLGTVQRHRSPRTTSNALYKGVVEPGGRAVYQGLIVVDEGAEKTDAYLANRNLLLGEGARADSMPKLIIGNNDVRCTHGSTTGKLDPAHLFYLQSRGLDKDEAKRLLVTGFLIEAAAALPQDYRPVLERRLEEIFDAKGGL